MDKNRISGRLERILRAAEELFKSLDDEMTDPADYFGIIEDEALMVFMELNNRTGEDPDAVLAEILGED